jgi:hypothetical protein
MRIDGGVASSVARAVMVLAPFVACALIYLPTLYGGFLSDDYSVLGALEAWRQDGRLLAALLAKFGAGLDVPSHYYRPLPMLSFGANSALAGADPLSWRLTNLAAHLAGGALVFAIAARLVAPAGPSRAIVGPALAAAVFLLFPTNVEAVAWVSGRYDVLATLFMLAAVACFQRAQHWRDRWGLAALIAALCAFASKESAALLPPFVLAIAIARRWRDGAAGASSGGLRDAAPWLIVGVAYFGLRTAIFGTPFRVYPDTSPLTALVSGEWLHTLASGGAWLDATLPVPFARAVFLATLGALVAFGAARCLRRRQTRAAWFAIGVTALVSVGMLLPHLSVLAPNGEEGRLFYTTAALLALLVALAWVAPSGSAATGGPRAAVAATIVALLISEAVLLRAAVAPWTNAGRQANALVQALPGTARAIPDGGYGFVVVPDHLGNVPFARNAQGGLLSPPVQPAPLSSHLIVQTPQELPGWPAHIARGLVDALRRYPLEHAWSAVAAGRATPGIAPSHYFCWAADRRAIVPIRVPPELAARDWLAAWREALGASPCREAARELAER